MTDQPDADVPATPPTNGPRPNPRPKPRDAQPDDTKPGAPTARASGGSSGEKNAGEKGAGETKQVGGAEKARGAKRAGAKKASAKKAAAAQAGDARADRRTNGARDQARRHAEPDRADPDGDGEATAPTPALVGARRASGADHPTPPPAPLAGHGLGGGGRGGYPGGGEPFYDDEWVELKPRSGPLRRVAIVVVVLAVLVGGSGITLLRWVNNEIHPPGDPGEPVEFTIEQGDTTNETANNLAAEGIIGNATVFRYWLRRQDGPKTFQSGKYDLAKNMDYDDVLAVLRAGPKPPVQINVTIPPGLTVMQMKQRLLEQLPGFDEAEFDAAFARADLNAPWAPNIGPYPARDGLFFPDTYAVDEQAASNEYALLKRMRDQMDAVLTELDVDNRAAALGYDRFQILTIASLIEEEAKIDEDRPKIARVIYNRLDRGMSLGIDASTRYAVGKISGEPLTVEDLNSDSPFNTRKATGLPPGPIAGPSRASIEAALAPAEGRWLYYVLTNEGGVEGAHTFAVTAREFERAKQVCIDLQLGCG